MAKFSLNRCAHDVKRNTLCRYYINWSLSMLLGMYSIIGFIMPVPSLLDFITTSPDTPCGTPGLGDTETVYALAAGALNGGSMVGAIVVAMLTRRISYKAMMLIGPVLQILGYCIYGLSIAGWMVVIGRGFAGFNYGATLAASMSYYSVSSTEYNELAVSLSKPEKPNIKKTLMIAHFSVAGIGYLISIGLATIVEEFFKYPQVNTYRWIAWFNIATGCFTIALQLLLFHNTDNDSFQCGNKSTEQEFKEVIKPSIKLSDIIIIIYILFTGAVIDTILVIVDTMTSVLLKEYFGMSVKYISYCFLGVSQMYYLPAWILILLNKCRIKSMVILFMSLVLATAGSIILVDWPYLYSSDSCDYSIDKPIQLATSSDNTCDDISSLCYALDTSSHNISFYIMPNSSNSVMYTVTHEHVCRDTMRSEALGSNACYISCTTNTLYTYIDSNTCNISSDCGNDGGNILYVMNTNNSDNSNMCENNTMTHSAVLDDLFQSKNGKNEYNDTLDGMKYIDEVAEKQAHCEQNDNCYWNPNSSTTGEYCYNCPTLCRIKDSLHLSQLIIALVIFLYAAESGRNMLFPIMSKLSPKHIQPVTTSILILVQDLSRLITPLWAVEIYLSTGRHTYAIAGTVIVLQLPVYVGFVVLNCYLYCKKQSSKKEIPKQRPELLPSQHEHIEGATNQMAIEFSNSLPFLVTPL